MMINPYTIPLVGIGCLIVVGTKDRRTIFRMENGGYSPILRPYACNTIVAWMKSGMMTTNSDTIPLARIGCLIVVGTKDRRTIFRMENGGYSPILRPYACNTIIAWRWSVMMTINPDIIPLEGIGCLIVVGTKDRRTIFRMENGGYSPILRPYACNIFIAWRWLVMMTINSDIILLARIVCLIVVGMKDRRTIFRMENGGYSPILRPYACNAISAWM